MEEVTMHRANEVLVKAVVTFVFLVGFAIPVSAQTVTAYEGARLIVGDGRVIENATLVVEGTRIAQVGSAADVRVPAGATRLSLAGKTLMPMIVDTHTHLSTTRDGLIRDLKQRAYFGVSGALSLGLDSFELLAMRNELIPGAARYFSAGKGITRIEPGRATFQINSEAEARKAVQENAAHRADIIKVWVDEREGKVEKVTPAQYAAIIDEAHNRGLRVTAHIFHMDDAKGLMRAGLDAFAHTAFATRTSTRRRCPFQGATVPHPHAQSAGSRGEEGLELAAGGSSSRRIRETRRGQQRQSEGAGLLRDSGPQPGKVECGGRARHARNRRQPAVGSARGDGGHGARRDDADAGHCGGDAQLGRIRPDDRCGHAGSGYERRLHCARCKSAGQHHQHATDLVRDPARRARGSRAAGALRNFRPKLITIKRVGC